MHNFQKIDAWKRGMDLAERTYLVTRSFPSEEKYGMTSQMRRCASSIPQNIAEGAGRRTEADFLRFVHIALGSAFELQTCLLLCSRIGYGSKEEMLGLVDETEQVQKLIFRFSEHLEKRVNNTSNS